MPNDTTTPEALSTIPNQPPTPDPAPAPAPAPAPEKPDITDAARANSKISELLSGSKKKGKSPTKEPAAPVPAVEPEKPVAPVVAALEPPTPATAPEPVPVKVRKTPPKPQMTPEEITRLAVAAAAEVNRPSQPATPNFELPDELKPMAEIYEQLEKLDAKKYKGIAKKQVDFMQREVDYATRWEQNEVQKLVSAGAYDPSNPPIYDGNDPQHSSFYKRHQPAIDPSDLEEAKFELRFNQRFEKMVQPKLQEADKTITQLRAKPEAEAAVNQFGNTMFTQLNPDAKAVTLEAFQKWADANPIEVEVASEIHGQVQPVVKAVSLLWDAAEDFNPQDETHLTAKKVFDAFEDELSSYEEPPSLNGRQWIPLSKFVQLPKDQQSKFCTTTKADVVRYISLQTARNIKNTAAQRREIAERTAAKLGYVKAQPSSMTAQPVTPTAAPSLPTVQSPSISASRPTSPTSGVAPSPQPKEVSVLGRLLGTH